MNGLLSWWVKNPIAANLSMVILLVAGCLSYFTGIEKEPFPITKQAIMEVNMRWPGAGPRDVEDQIIVRFEDAVKNVEGIKHIKSIAREGYGSVTIYGKERVDHRKFADDIRERINSVNGLPADSERPVVKEKVSRKTMIRLALHGDLSVEQLTLMSEKIRQEISRLPLISNVRTYGGGWQQISIEVSEQAMSQHELSIDEISAAIRNSSVNASTGTVKDEAGVLMLRVRNRAEAQQEFEDIIIRQNSDGATLYLKDVARVFDGIETSRYISIFDGEPTVLIDILNSEYMNIPKMSGYVHRYVEAKSKQLPEGVSLTVFSDWNEAYQGRLSTILNSAVTGLILVFLLLLLFLQPKIALWVTAGIGTSFAASFALLPAMDISLNMISLFAFMMVIGIAVDDAIVIGESVHLANEAGEHGENAAIKGVSQVARPVIFGVLTTIVVFAPMAFLPGKNAEFTRSIAVVVMLSLAFSLFEALCILPSHLSHLRHSDEKSGKKGWLLSLQTKFASSLEWLCTYAYMPLVRFCHQYKFSVIAIFLGSLLIGHKLLENSYITKSFMPKIADDKISLRVELPPTATHERMLQILQQIKTAQNELIAFASDRNSGRLVAHDYTRLRDTSITSDMKLVAVEERAMEIQEATNKLQELIGEIPDAEDIELKSTLNTKEPTIGFALNSSDISSLKEATQELKSQLSTYDGVSMIRDSMDKGSQEMIISLKPGVENLGISLREVSKQVKQAYFAQEVQKLPRVGGDIRVKVRYSKEDRESIDTLQHLKIRTRDGREIPLLSVVDLELQPGVQRIIRRDGSIVAHVWAEYSGDDRNGIYDDLGKSFFPELKKRFPLVNNGRSEGRMDEDDFNKTVMVLEGLALMASYMLMAIAFKSYLQPLLIMSAIPFAYLGALGGHMIHDTPYGMFSMLGILAASGVVINDNLVLVDAINRYRQAGIGVKDAVMRACQLRFRPIVLTSLTTFIGLMPMLSAQSVQAKFLVPMVVSLAYGVLAATVVTLIFVPSLYWASTAIAANWQRFKHRALAKPLPQDSY